MKKYYKGWITTPIENYVPASTDKAIALTVAGGYTDANDEYAWFPKSQIIIGKPNEYGNAYVFIPVWLFKSKHIDPRRIREIECLGDEVVEM